MSTTAQARRIYDHRIRQLVRDARDPGLFPELDIPRSTARSWLRRGLRPVVSLGLLDTDAVQLQRQVMNLRRQIDTLTALVRLLLTLLRIFDVRLDGQRLPDGRDKAYLLRAIQRTRERLPLGLILKLLGLSPARYHAWKRRELRCELADRSPCPRTTPQGLTLEEVQSMGEMVTSDEYRHLSIATLALHAQRLGRVFASATTWRRLIHQRGWLRPRRRLYPAKPKVGLRAIRPGEFLHLDVTILKLLDGSRAYIHAVIDNFSRKILAWKVAPRLEPASTCEVLIEAGRQAGLIEPVTVIADSGVENVNQRVNALIEAGLIHRILAQVQVSFSNSMIEAFWRSLKHRWLYLHLLEGVDQVQRLMAFYVQQHNQVMPHPAFKGQTPDEIFFGTGDDIPAQLVAARAKARAARIAANRAMSCGACQRSDDPG